VGSVHFDTVETCCLCSFCRPDKLFNQFFDFRHLQWRRHTAHSPGPHIGGRHQFPECGLVAGMLNLKKCLDAISLDPLDQGDKSRNVGVIRQAWLTCHVFHVGNDTCCLHHYQTGTVFRPLFIIIDHFIRHFAVRTGETGVHGCHHDTVLNLDRPNGNGCGQVLDRCCHQNSSHETFINPRLMIS